MNFQFYSISSSPRSLCIVLASSGAIIRFPWGTVDGCDLGIGSFSISKYARRVWHIFPGPTMELRVITTISRRHFVSNSNDLGVLFLFLLLCNKYFDLIWILHDSLLLLANYVHLSCFNVKLYWMMHTLRYSGFTEAARHGSSNCFLTYVNNLLQWK